jgi:hypothetical protein
MAKKQKIQQQRELARKRAAEFSQGTSAESPLPSEQSLSHKEPVKMSPATTVPTESKSAVPQQPATGNAVSEPKCCNENEPDVKELAEEEAIRLAL